MQTLGTPVPGESGNDRPPPTVLEVCQPHIPHHRTWVVSRFPDSSRVG